MRRGCFGGLRAGARRIYGAMEVVQKVARQVVVLAGDKEVIVQCFEQFKLQLIELSSPDVAHEGPLLVGRVVIVEELGGNHGSTKKQPLVIALPKPKRPSRRVLHVTYALHIHDPYHHVAGAGLCVPQDAREIRRGRERAGFVAVKALQGAFRPGLFEVCAVKDRIVEHAPEPLD